jgi:magnesium transporter
MLVLTDLETDKIAHERELDRFFWLDLESPSDAELEETGKLLGLHAVAMEDTREWEQRPKVDTYENHLLLVFYSARLSARPLEVHVYVSGSFVLTVRRASCTVLDELHAELEKEPIQDEGYLVYRILDTLTDAWFPVIEGIEGRVDTLEDEVLLRARREQLPGIYRLRQDVRELWRLGQAQREVFLQASEAMERLPGLSQGTHAWFRDVNDHLMQVAGELSRQNDDLVSLTGTYFNDLRGRDHRHGLLRPELRLVREPHQLGARLPHLRRRRPRGPDRHRRRDPLDQAPRPVLGLDPPILAAPRRAIHDDRRTRTF